MDLYQLQCFCVAARMEHISRAADELKITQPALSKIIVRVEEYAGVPLFDRVKGRLYLNSNGQIMLRTLESVFSVLNVGLEEIHNKEEVQNNQIRLASSVDGMFYILRDQLHEEYPEIQVRYSVMGAHHIRDSFIEGNLDFALTDSMVDGPDIEWKYISEEEVYLIVPEGHKFWNRAQVSFRELQGENIICNSVGDPLRELIDSCCRTAGFEPNVVIESTMANMSPLPTPNMVQFMCAHRFTQIMQSPFGGNPHIRAIRLRNPICSRVTGLAYSTNRNMNQSMKRFRDFVMDFFHELDLDTRKFMDAYFAQRASN